MTQRLPHLLAVLLLLPAVCFGDKFNKVVNGDHRDEKLQKSFLKFPLLTPATDEEGKPAFQKFEFDEPVNIDGVDFYGFRFQVSRRKAKEDLVWAFISPSALDVWYILPQNGEMEGFDEYFHKPRTRYQNTDHMFPVQAKELYTQRLSGNSLANDKYYLIWFAFKPRPPARMSLELTFANVPPKKIHNCGFLEKVLGLHRN